MNGKKDERVDMTASSPDFFGCSSNLHNFGLDSEDEFDFNLEKLEEKITDKKDFRFYLHEKLTELELTDSELLAEDLAYLKNFSFEHDSLLCSEANDVNFLAPAVQSQTFEGVSREKWLEEIANSGTNKFLQERFTKTQENLLDRNLLIGLKKQNQEFNIDFNLEDLKNLRVNLNCQPNHNELSAKLLASRKVNKLIQKKLSKLKKNLFSKYSCSLLEFELEDLEELEFPVNQEF